jgi:hypothetical protein
MAEKEKKCKFIKPGGDRCNAWHVKGSPYCHFHDPNNKDKHLKASVKGGGRKLPVLSDKEHPEILKLRDPESIQVFNEILAHYAITGKIHHDIVKAVNGLMANQIRVVELQYALIRNPLPKDGDEVTIQDYDNTNGELSEIIDMMTEIARKVEEQGIEL